MLHPALSMAGIRNAVFDREKQPKMLYFKQAQSKKDNSVFTSLYHTVRESFVQEKSSTHVGMRHH